MKEMQDSLKTDPVMNFINRTKLVNHLTGFSIQLSFF
jgi:hypothetical protein